MCGGKSPNYAEQDAKARVAAAAEKARVEAETAAKTAEANSKLLADKESQANTESTSQAQQKALLALSLDDQKNEKKTSTFKPQSTLLGG